MKSRLLLCFFIATATYCWGQNDSIVLIENSLPQDNISQKNMDTAVVVKEKKHSPALAGGLSAILPGLGQAYNKKYWKIPIDYVGFAATGGCVYYFTTEYIKYRNEYRIRLDGKDELRNPDFKDSDDNNINSNKLYYQLNMQRSIVVLAACYFINILDAIVDAHLLSFDISDNLSLHLIPDFNASPTFAKQKLGLTFTFNIK